MAGAPPTDDPIRWPLFLFLANKLSFESCLRPFVRRSPAATTSPAAFSLTTRACPSFGPFVSWCPPPAFIPPDLFEWRERTHNIFTTAAWRNCCCPSSSLFPFQATAIKCFFLFFFFFFPSLRQDDVETHFTRGDDEWRCLLAFVVSNNKNWLCLSFSSFYSKTVPADVWRRPNLLTCIKCFSPTEMPKSFATTSSERSIATRTDLSISRWVFFFFFLRRGSTCTSFVE